MRLEVGEPEDSHFGVFQCLADVLGLILVNHILEINLVKIVGPRVEDLEALVLHVLGTVSLNIGFNEIEGCLEGD